MFCTSCGAAVDPSARFCPACGKGAGAAPVPATVSRSRLGRHLGWLAGFWLIFSALRVMEGVSLFYGARIARRLAHGWLTGWWDGWGAWPLEDFLPYLISFGGWWMVILGIAGLVAGWGLYQRHSWARPMALIVGIFSLFRPPVGTALGAYTLWVLLPSASEEEYQRTARP